MCSLQRPIFASRSFVVCVWRQRSSDQDDHKGKKPYNETCFQNPQSCSWLVVRSNQFGPQNPNQIHRHQKPTRRHANQEKFHTWRVESFFVFFNISHSSSTKCSEVMWKRAQKESGEETAAAKSRPMMNLVARSSERPPSALSSTASESLVKTRQESQSPLSAQA